VRDGVVKYGTDGGENEHMEGRIGYDRRVCPMPRHLAV